MRRALLLVLLSIGSLQLLACGPTPKPASTTPATAGSAPILPSPTSAETVPRDGPAPAPSSSAQQ